MNFLLQIDLVASTFLFELLRPLSLPNSKFWWIYLTRVHQYDKKRLILKADLEFVIPWAALFRVTSKMDFLLVRNSKTEQIILAIILFAMAAAKKSSRIFTACLRVIGNHQIFCTDSLTIRISTSLFWYAGSSFLD